MVCLRILHRREKPHFSKSARSGAPAKFRNNTLVKGERGSALLEFAITLPLLVVFVVGIYDFSGAFNQKQKIEQAAQEGAITAGAQPTSDIDPLNGSTTGPDSLQPVVTVIFNSLAGAGVLPLANQGSCLASAAKMAPHTGLTWTYTISGCSGAYAADNLVITINRGWVSGSGSPGSPAAVGTSVQVAYPYHWRFNSVIQLLVPGASYAATTQVTESATVQNQL
jgi:Flp pilus assembly protein TadG